MHVRPVPADRAFSPGLGALVVAFGVAYGAYSVLGHWHFRTSAFDLGIFDQIVWHYSRFELPASSVRGLPNMLGDHFHPILVLLAPLYWVAPRPEMLLIAQAGLLAASIVPVFAYARQRIGHGLGLAVAAAYGLFWGIQKAVAFDFHELAFAPLLIGVLILGLERRRWGLFWTGALGLLFVKEDMSLIVAAAGALLIWRGERRHGWAALALALGTFATLVLVVVPRLAGTAAYEYASAYPSAAAALRDPAGLLLRLVTPAAKLRLTLLWVGPFLFLPLVSPLAVLAVPRVLELLLSSSPHHWAAHFHYSAPLAPILAMAAADGLARLGWVARPRLARTAVGFVFVMCAVLPGKLPVWRLLSPAYYRFSEPERTGHRLIAAVPPDASVVAQNAIVPHLSRREHLYLLRPGAPESDYVVASATVDGWPNSGFAEIEELLRQRRARGYESVVAENGWVILRRGRDGAR